MIYLLIGICFAGICGLFRSLLAIERQERIIEILSRHVDNCLLRSGLNSDATDTGQTLN